MENRRQNSILEFKQPIIGDKYLPDGQIQGDSIDSAIISRFVESGAATGDNRGGGLEFRRPSNVYIGRQSPSRLSCNQPFTSNRAVWSTTRPYTLRF